MPVTFTHELISIYGNIICACGEQFDFSDVGEMLCPECGKAYTVNEDVTLADEAALTPEEQAVIDGNARMITVFSLILRLFQRSLVNQGFTRQEAYDLTRDWWMMQLGKRELP